MPKENEESKSSADERSYKDETQETRVEVEENGIQ